MQALRRNVQTNFSSVYSSYLEGDTCQSRMSAHFPGRSWDICSTSLSPRPDRHWKDKKLKCLRNQKKKGTCQNDVLVSR